MKDSGVDMLEDEYEISTDKKRLELVMIHDFLANQSYWTKDIPFEVMKKSIANAFCFGVCQGKQVGFSDTRRRSDIIALAVLRAGFEVSDAVYIGDGLWGIKAAREFGMGFVGVGTGHERLRQHGASRVLASFADKSLFFNSLMRR
jgi:hypothetical protein